jgi:hypothetical protein
MKKLVVLSAIVASLMMLSVSADAAVRFGIGLGYGRPAYGPGPLWVGPGYWGPPIYHVVPVRSDRSGELKIDTNAKDASVYINGAFAGTVGKLKTVWLRSGSYDIEIRATNGGVFDQKVFVPIDKKVVIEPVFTLAS